MEPTDPQLKLAFDFGRMRGAATAASQFFGAQGQRIAQGVRSAAPGLLNKIQGMKPAATQAMNWIGSNAPWQSQAGDSGAVKGLRFAGNMVRNHVVGSPVDLAHDIGAKGLGGVFKDHFIKQMPADAGTFGKVMHYGGQAMSLGLPALQLGMAAVGPRENRGANLGGAAASIAASPYTSRLGMPGTLLSAAASGLGRRVGRAFDPKPQPPPQQPQLPPPTTQFNGQPAVHRPDGSIQSYDPATMHRLIQQHGYDNTMRAFYGR